MSVIDDARSLSSGTMAKLIRDDGLEYGYRCRAYDVIDAYQSRFVWWLGNCDVEAVTWIMAWREWVRLVNRARKSWKSAYQGSVDYSIDGSRYECRCHAMPQVAYNGDYFETGIMKHLGCVFKRCCMSDGVPNEVIAAFPGYHPLSATFDWGDPDESGYRSVENWQYVYHPDFGAPPKHVVGICGYYHHPFSVVDYDKLDWDRDIRPFKDRRAG
jgi:hypothetical protein